MAKNTTPDDYLQYKESLKELILPQPLSLEQVRKGAVVIDLLGSDKKKDRIGIVDRIEDKQIYIDFSDCTVVTELKFYGRTWGLKK
jgi:hypothetical protein